MLVLKNIFKDFNGVTVLKDLNLELNSGLNFIVGPSGSGKSTLLKILSGMDKEYKGEVIYRGRNLKDFNENDMNSYYFNSIGFVWQNFQLINHLSVEDNVKMSLELTDLSEAAKNSKVKTMLKKMAIDGLAKKNVSQLSGGQKQRVAIARTLVKEPEIIIADEPTGALDKKSSMIIMDVLKKISKTKLVIVVTHDKSLVDKDSNCFLLKDKVITQVGDGAKGKALVEKKDNIKPRLSIKRAGIVGVRNFKGMALKFALTSVILVLSSFFLLLNFSGSIANEQQSIIEELVAKKGNGLRDIAVFSSVTGGASTEEEDSNKPNIDIEQDVSKVLDKYKNDERIEHIIPALNINNMKVSIDGVVNNYQVETSNTVASIDKVEAGRLPNLDGREVTVTKLFLEKNKLKPEDVIGKKISIEGEGYDWSSGQPQSIKQTVKDLTIVGVVDSTIRYDSPDGKPYEFELEDAFIYGVDVVKELNKQKNSSDTNISCTIRVKKVEDIMNIVEELNAEGITPFGEFESVKDILKINNTSGEQTSSMAGILAVIAVVVTLVVTIINGYLRKGEYAILKINGYSKNSLLNLSMMEYLLIALSSSVIFVAGLPVINSLSIKLFGMSISGSNSMVMGIVIIIIQGLIAGLITSFIAAKTNISNNLMTGDR
ncbi:MAG: ABC transporter ATP-binding protein [Clostridium sp.]|nr:ABC transporter ATP-binding protein [Clostridium sp.]MDU7083580.1 ABC transporter ATP-binding protein [Clostridium sp.]